MDGIIHKHTKYFPRKERWALHAKLQLLVIASVLPMFAFTLNSFYASKSLVQKEIVREIGLLTENQSSQHQLLIEATRVLLPTLASSPELQSQDQGACTQLLERLLTQNRVYATIGYVDLNGDLVCSGVPASQPVNLGDRDYVKGAIKNRDFSEGTYQLGRVTGTPVVSYGYPVIAADGTVQGVVYASVDLTYESSLVDMSSLPPNSAYGLLDRNGVIMIRIPDGEKWWNFDLTETGVGATIITSKKGSFIGAGVDGVERLYSFTSVGDPMSPSAYVYIGVPQQSVFEGVRAAFVRNIISLMLVAVCALLLAYLFGERLVIRQVEGLKEIDALKSRFVSMAAHQLRTPLTAIRWLLEAVGSKRLSKARQQLLEDAYESAGRLNSLVSDLLNVSRIETGRLKVNVEPVDVVTLAEAVIKEMRPQMKMKGQTLTTHWPDHSSLINLDPLLIRQVLLNLLSNAVKYTPEKGSIHVSVRQRDADVLVSVMDTGIGIPLSEQAKIFGNFYRATNATQFTPEGTGLGLSLAKSLVEMQGGKMGFTSQEGHGSTFWFTLPVRGAKSQEGEVTLGT